ncbi:MAG TPA: hypothetical protein VG222_02415 [Vicinamibacterales bacterium]|nr:hypothetical protein [Vicinamibacterales bacterium]
MKHTSFITASVFLAALALSVAPAAAQARGHAGGGGGRAVVGRAAPRVGPAPRIVSRGRLGGVPFRSSFRPFYGSGFYGYPYGLGFGLYGGYPFGYYGAYGYPYGFGYPYGYAGYASFGYGGYYGYPGYYAGYPGYDAPSAGYAAAVEGEAYGGVRIESRDRDAQVFADGYYVGIVDDFNGTFQHLNLRAGPHRIEIRSPNAPPLTFDVNVEPGRTITYRAGAR